MSSYAINAALWPVLVNNVQILVAYYLVDSRQLKIAFTRKYPLRRYILGVLTHTTALD